MINDVQGEGQLGALGIVLIKNQESATLVALEARSAESHRRTAYVDAQIRRIARQTELVAITTPKFNNTCN